MGKKQTSLFVGYSSSLSEWVDVPPIPMKEGVDIFYSVASSSACYYAFILL